MTTTNTRDISNTPFSFCSKFEKLLNDDNRQPIVAAFKQFCNFSTDAARINLWRLTYNDEVAYEILAILGLTPEMVSYEIRKLRDELRKQYEKLHSGFLTTGVSEACKVTFESLAQKTDYITASVVNKHCCYRVYEMDVERTLYLLSSDKENFFFGGLCELDFDKEEAEYLKPFHMQIYDLLKALYDYKKQFDSSFINSRFQRFSNPLDETCNNLPFYLGVPVAEAVAEVPEMEPAEEPVEEPMAEPDVEQPTQTSSEYKSLTAEEILAHKDAFASFVKDSDLNILVQIGQLGFDLNTVMAKKEAISNLLKATESLEKAEAKILAAAKAKEKAKAKLLKATEALNK